MHPNSGDEGSSGQDANRGAGTGSAGEKAGSSGSGAALGPLLQRFSATYSKSEPHYLSLKNRSKWWKRGTFPRVRSTS